MWDIWERRNIILYQGWMVWLSQVIMLSKACVSIETRFLSLHHTLCHLPFTVMLWVCKVRILPRRFLKLRNYLLPWVLCLFGQAHRRPWRHKASAASSGGTIRNPRVAAQSNKVCTNQLVSAQPGFVHQEKGSPTRARIWWATIFIDCATDWIKVCLMQEATRDTMLGV